MLIGAVVGAAGVLYIQKSAPTAVDGSEADAVTVIFARVADESELVTASQTYVEIEKVTDTKRFFDLFDLRFTENSYWYRYAGTIKAAVNLETAELVGQEGTTITIRLQTPYISSNTPDMEVSGVLEENNNILNPIQIKDVDSYRQEVAERVEAAALEGDLIEEAKQGAVEELTQLFSVGLGSEYTIVVEWV